MSSSSSSDSSFFFSSFFSSLAAGAAAAGATKLTIIKHCICFDMYDKSKEGSDCKELRNHGKFIQKFSEPSIFHHILVTLLITKQSLVLPAAAAPAAGAAPTPEPTLVIMLLRLRPSKALANKPGQYGSTLTSAAFKIVWIFSAYN